MLYAGPSRDRKLHNLIPLDAKNRLGGSLRSLFGLNAAELSATRMASLGEPKWRGKQIGRGDLSPTDC